MATKKRAKKTAKRKSIRTERIQLPKGLTRELALRWARGRWKYDHRGFGYDPKTGIATAT